MSVKVSALQGSSSGVDSGQIIAAVCNQANLFMAAALQSAIFNSANFSSIVTDVKGVIQLFNVGSERMLGYTAAEVMHIITPADIFDQGEVDLRAKALSAEHETSIKPGFEALVFKASQGSEDIYELTYIRKDGSRFPAVVAVTALRDDQDAISGYLLIGTDNTARKQVEAERLRHEQVLQDKNSELENVKLMAEKARFEKSDFLSSMSHELRSPLTAILGFAQLMESDSPAPTPVQKANIAQILQSGWHLLTVINEILALAKVESRQSPLLSQPVSLAEVMFECRGIIEKQAQQRSIKLIFPRLDSPCIVMADLTRVQQVLLTLLSNAVRYNRLQGEVELQCPESTPGRILVTVRDTGVGLRPEELAKLFRAFNHLGQVTGKEDGAGIGLVMAKRLVEQMGGVIGVESTFGVGSVFWFELAAVDEPDLDIKESNAVVAEQLKMSRGERLQTLLYVEDNPANLNLVEQLVARCPDIHLLTALDGKSGIEMACAAKPDVILMDINLPGISGINAMKILRSDCATAHIPVIALSANAMPADIEKGLKAGFFRYITKPIKVNEFMAVLDVALAQAGKKSERSMSDFMPVAKDQVGSVVGVAIIP